MKKLHNIAGLSEAGGPGGLKYKLKIGYHSRFFWSEIVSVKHRGALSTHSMAYKWTLAMKKSHFPFLVLKYSSFNTFLTHFYSGQKKTVLKKDCRYLY